MLPLSRNYRATLPASKPGKGAVSAQSDAGRMTRRMGSGIDLLADETRRTMIALLALRPRHPTELSRELGLSLPAVSRQLRLLTDAGLVRVARSRLDGRRRVYTVDPIRHGRITAWLAGTGVGLEDAVVSPRTNGSGETGSQ